MDTIPFPDTRSDRLAETAMDELAQWAEEKLEIGVSAMVLIGLLETYKSALTYNLLVDEEYEDQTMGLLAYLGWVKKLWTMVVDIVKLIEQTIPDDGAGKEKLAAFDLLLKAAIEKADDIDEEFEKLQPVAHDIVRAVVTLFNATGMFKKK